MQSFSSSNSTRSHVSFFSMESIYSSIAFVQFSSLIASLKYVGLQESNEKFECTSISSYISLKLIIFIDLREEIVWSDLMLDWEVGVDWATGIDDPPWTKFVGVLIGVSLIGNLVCKPTSSFS